jgi:hypothetical protein
MDQHWLETMATQHALASLSDDPGQFRRQDPMLALLNQCHRARSGQDEGMNYMTVKF